ncbi:MAG TPA: O-antigen ligase family protein [Candidatus Krumholzibacteria bacterium]|nr:O-antigen ligase family protein [Candidatus Krumholzibacteria bacterium]
MARSMERWAQAGLVLAPWAGVGLVQATTGRALGAGVQPAYPVLLVVIVLAAIDVLRHEPARDHEPAHEPDRTGLWLVAVALGWTALSTASLWTRDVVGLAGDAPWSKGLKQTVLLAFFAAAALAYAQVVRRAGWRGLERAASIGLAIAVLAGLVQAVTFHLQIPGSSWLERLSSSNPSIAAGSAELYLGDRFVGIPRMRGPFPEPLHFGSYLVAVLPVTLAAAVVSRGTGRVARAVLGALGLLCLVMTFSRGAWVGAATVAGLVAVAMLTGRLPAPDRRLLALGLVAIVVLGAVAWPVLTGVGWHEVPGIVAQRVAQSAVGHDMSNLTRFWSWGVAWELFREHPIHGVGFGGFGFWYFERAPEGGGAAHFGWPVTNSLPLQLLAETGLIGLVLWLGCLGPALRRLVPVGSRPSAAAVVAACAIAGVLVQLLTFSQWDLPHLWMLFGAGVASGSRIPRVV